MMGFTNMVYLLVSLTYTTRGVCLEELEEPTADFKMYYPCNSYVFAWCSATCARRRSGLISVTTMALSCLRPRREILSSSADKSLDINTLHPCSCTLPEPFKMAVTVAKSLAFVLLLQVF